MTPSLPSYEQSLTPHLGKYSFFEIFHLNLSLLEIPPSYDEAINIKSPNDQQQTSLPIHSISFSIDQTSQSNPRINNK